MWGLLLTSFLPLRASCEFPEAFRPELPRPAARVRSNGVNGRMKYPACLLLTFLMTALCAVARADLPRPAELMGMSPCPAVTGPERADRLVLTTADWLLVPSRTVAPQLLLAMALTETGGSADLRPSGSGLFSPKRMLYGRLVLHGPDEDWERWRYPRVRRADVFAARQSYSVVGILSAACLGLGGLTLSMQSGGGRAIRFSARSWRSGGVVGVQGRF